MVGKQFHEIEPNQLTTSTTKTIGQFTGDAVMPGGHAGGHHREPGHDALGMPIELILEG